ncbi:hypothetical protein OF83DRAFT_6759 [Amylostereum chailletii]|nr:hypothetical protein OF83DRAFT_6759 [Amylostereum chailletii]
MVPPSTLLQKQTAKVKPRAAAQALVLPGVRPTRLHPNKTASADESDPRPRNESRPDTSILPSDPALPPPARRPKHQVPAPNNPALSSAANRLARFGEMLLAAHPPEVISSPQDLPLNDSEAVSGPSTAPQPPVDPRPTTPFTLSQISPRKGDECPGSKPLPAPPLSPMRPPTKRSVSPSFETRAPHARPEMGSLRQDSQEGSLSKRVKTSHATSTKPRLRPSFDRAVKRAPGRLASQNQKTSTKARGPAVMRTKDALASSTGASSSRTVRGHTQNVGKVQDQSLPSHRHGSGLVSDEKPVCPLSAFPLSRTPCGSTNI